MAGAIPRSSTEVVLPHTLLRWRGLIAPAHCGHRKFLSSCSVLASLSGTNPLCICKSFFLLQAQEELSWTHPAQNIRQSSGRAAAWVPLAQPSSGHHSRHHAKERRSKTFPIPSGGNGCTKQPMRQITLCQTFQVSLTARAFLGQLRWSLRVFSSPSDHCGNGTLQCCHSKTFRLM